MKQILQSSPCSSFLHVHALNALGTNGLNLINNRILKETHSYFHFLLCKATKQKKKNLTKALNPVQSNLSRVLSTIKDYPSTVLQHHNKDQYRNYSAFEKLHASIQREENYFNKLTMALKWPLSHARATLYTYCRHELSRVYMSAIFPCIS